MKFVISRISKETSNPEDPPCIDAQYDSKHKFWTKEF